VLICTELDWLARSMIDLGEILKTVEAKGTNLKVLDQREIDTTTPNGRLLFWHPCFCGRVRAGAHQGVPARRHSALPETARCGRAKPGRPLKVDPARVKALKAKGKTMRQIMAAADLSRASVYRAPATSRFYGCRKRHGREGGPPGEPFGGPLVFLGSKAVLRSIYVVL
jgi:DNA invertase Pin-like site-specific DNA recombinase